MVNLVLWSVKSFASIVCDIGSLLFFFQSLFTALKTDENIVEALLEEYFPAGGNSFDYLEAVSGSSDFSEIV